MLIEVLRGVIVRQDCSSGVLFCEWIASTSNEWTVLLPAGSACCLILRRRHAALMPGSLQTSSRLVRSKPAACDALSFRAAQAAMHSRTVACSAAWVATPFASLPAPREFISS